MRPHTRPSVSPAVTLGLPTGPQEMLAASW
jgi:hypothetical protein